MLAMPVSKLPAAEAPDLARNFAQTVLENS